MVPRGACTVHACVRLSTSHSGRAGADPALRKLELAGGNRSVRWKGKNFDGPMTQIFTGRVGQHRNKHGQNALIIGGLALAYLAMVAEFGYIVALMQSGLALREQFFNPSRFRNGMGTKFKAIFMGSPHKTQMTRFGRTHFALKSKTSSVSLLFETLLSFFPCRVTRESPSRVI
jgi:hypothetical protein